MLFPDVSPPLEATYDAVAKALLDPAGRLYLDSSLLIHCFELNRDARSDLMDSLDLLNDRVGVPLWSAKETWEYVRKGRIRRPLEPHHARLKGQLDKFKEDARRYIDDQTVADLSRDEFLGKVDEAGGALLNLLAAVSKFEPEADQTSSRLFPFLESRRLRSDLVAILKVVQDTGELRYQHDVPPGQGDGGAARTGAESDETSSAARRGKQRNRYGDQIIWQEILQDCASRKAEHLVLATRDTAKDDWVYVPAKVLDDRGRPQANIGTVTLPLPLLVHEATTACPTLKTVNILSLEMFAGVLSRNLKHSIPHLVAALQETKRRPDRTQGTGEGGDAGESEGEGAVAQSAEPVTFTSADMDYVLNPEDPFHAHLRVLQSPDWALQNKAVTELEQQAEGADRDRLLQLGRGLVAASLSGAVEPVLALGRLLAPESSDQVRTFVLLGALAETYLAEGGEPKKPKAPPAVSEVLFGNARRSEFAEVYKVVEERLQPQRRSYLALPSEPIAEVSLTIIIEGHALKGVLAGDAPLIEEDAPPARIIRRTQKEFSLTVGELLDDLAEEYVIPRDRLVASVPATQRIEVPPFTGFVVWGPSTGRNLR